MHEVGISQGVLETAREAAQENGAKRVTDLHLVVTAAADSDEESIRMYFEMLTCDDELLRGATLHFERRAVDASYLECGGSFAAASRRDRCPSCGSPSVQLDPGAVMLQLTNVCIDDRVDDESGGA